MIAVFLFVSESTGETEDEAEQKRIRKKRENKERDMGTPVALVAEPAPPPGSLVRGQRKGAVSFFTELREQLQCAPVVTPTGAPEGPQVPPAAASPSREQVEVVEFHSRNKRKRKPGEGENTKVMSNLYV